MLKIHRKSAKNYKDNMFPQNLCIPSKLSSELSECIFDEPAGKKISKLKISGSNSKKK